MNIPRKLIACYRCELLDCDLQRADAGCAAGKDKLPLPGDAGAAVARRSLCQYACVAVVASLSSQVLFELT